MIDIEKSKIAHLIKSEGWKEAKKLIKAKRYDLACKLIDKTAENLDNEIIRVKAYDEIVSLIESIGKAYIVNKGDKKKEITPLGELPPIFK